MHSMVHSIVLTNRGAHPSRGGPIEKSDQGSVKAHGCGYMGVALSMGLYKHDLVGAAQSSASLRYFNANTKVNC